MTPQTRASLKELQQLDQDLAQVRSAVQDFQGLLEEVDAPVLRSEQEVKGLQTRLQDVKLVENRLELTIEERRARSKKLQERMEGVRNLREEAAVHAELEMVRRALENDEQEALSLLDQIRRIEERLEEQEAAYQEALAEVEPRRVELTQEQQATEARLGGLEAKRRSFADGIDPKERRVYESIMAGSTGVAVAELTQDGACGNCFSLVPLQVQNEIRHAAGMIRCEGCGVILTPESAEGIARAEAENLRIMDPLRVTEEEREMERALVAEAIEMEEAKEAALTEEAASGEEASEAETALPEAAVTTEESLSAGEVAPAAEVSELETAPPGEEPEPEAAPTEEASLAEEAAEPETASAEEVGLAAVGLELGEDPTLDEDDESGASPDDEVADGEAGL